MAIEPKAGPPFQCEVRYSDLVTLERHHVFRQARREGLPCLPPLPGGHTLPIVGKLMDGHAVSRSRGLDIQLYLQAVLNLGGGVRTTTLDMLLANRDASATDPSTEEAADAVAVEEAV
jgi:hypothetical protein